MKNSILSGSGVSAEAMKHVFETPLILGGSNVHQDPHFASFYLRASMSAVTEPVYPGYSFILAVYDGGVERYFVSAKEAANTAGWLIERCAANPAWLAAQLASIETFSKQLENAFPPNTTAERLARASMADLVQLYFKHTELHNSLYRVARIPEALDRGRPFFTDYLKAQLRRAGVIESDVASVFSALTAPSRPSVIAEEEHAFREIVLEARNYCPDLADAHMPAMHLTADIRAALRQHNAKWSWLSYHGFRNRTLPTESDLVRRLCESFLLRTTGQIPDEAAPALPNLDENIRTLFGLYAEIGRVKLLRRFYQLRNFYYLDMLIAEFSSRLNCSEWLVRCCLPGELLDALDRGFVDPSVEERQKQCAVLYSSDGELVVAGEAFDALMADVATCVVSQSVDKRVRFGASARPGIVRATARMLGVKSSNAFVFNAGDILVCEAADPDMLPLIRKAGAVITQQGGVTSHASVLCRELGVPTIVGIDGLLDFVVDGEMIEVDAGAGKVTRIGALDSVTLAQLAVRRDDWANHTVVGTKAANLTRAIGANINVPGFVVLSWDEMTRMLASDVSDLDSALCEVWDSLSPSDGLIVRSSDLDEDHPGGSRAGNFASLKIPDRSQILDKVAEFASINGERGYRGALILQKFVPAQLCGVSVDGDPEIGRGKLVTEFVRGPMNTVTSGQGSPTRVVYSYEAGEFDLSQVKRADLAVLAADPIADLATWLRGVADIFGRPAYVEWGYLNGAFWLYQVRGVRG